MNEAQLEYAIEIKAKLDPKEAIDGVPGAVEKIQKAANENPVWIKLQIDPDSIKNVRSDVENLEARLHAVATGSGTTSSNPYSSANSIEKQLADLERIDQLENEIGSGSRRGGRSHGGGADRLSFDLSGANAEQLKRVKDALVAAYASGEENPLKAVYRGAGSAQKFTITGQRTAEDIMGLILAQAETAQGAGLQGKLTLSGSMSSFGQTQQMLREIGPTVQEINQAREVERTNNTEHKNTTKSLRGMREEVDGTSQALRALGMGQARRGVGGLLTETFGGGMVGAFAGGFMGSVASSIFLPLAWQIGDAVMQGLQEALQTPTKIEKGYAELSMQEWQRARQEPYESDAARRQAIVGSHAALYRVVHDTGLNASSAMAQLDTLQAAVGVDRGFDLMTQFAAIAASQRERTRAGGQDKALASLVSGYEHLKTQGRLADVGAFIREHPELNEEMRQEFRRMYHLERVSPNTTEKLYQEYLSSGRIASDPNGPQLGPSMLDKLIHNVAQKDYTALEKLQEAAAYKGYLGAEWGQNVYWRESGKEQEKYLKERGIERPVLVPRGSGDVMGNAGGYGAAPPSELFPSNTTIPSPGYSRYAYYNKESLPGIRGGREDITRQDERILPTNYRWTSFTGLAEQMQMMWSGAPADAMGTAATGLQKAADRLNEAADKFLGPLPNQGVPGPAGIIPGGYGGAG